MSDIPIAPAHLSYSSLTTWLGCGEKFRLTRVERIPEAPAWWFLGGSAVHAATEVFDRLPPDGWQDFNPADAFGEALRVELHRENIAPGEREGVRSSRGQTFDWWMGNGPVMVANWVDWRRETRWECVEIEANITGNIAGVEVKAYLDRLFRVGDDHVVVDVKTGARRPDSALQLGVYRHLLGLRGVDVASGAYWMGRKPEFDWHVLDIYTPEYLTALFGGLSRARRDGVFLPNVSAFCRSCGVGEFCWAWNPAVAPPGAKERVSVSTKMMEDDNG